MEISKIIFKHLPHKALQCDASWHHDGGVVQHSDSVKGVIYIRWDQKSQLFLSVVAFSQFMFWEAHRKPKKCSVV